MSKQKTTALSALFRNKELRNAIVEGFFAPNGSTKKDKARAIFKSISHANKVVYDGQGGVFNIGEQDLSRLSSTTSPTGQDIFAGTEGKTYDPTTGQMVPMRGQEQVAPQQDLSKLTVMEQPNKILFIPPAPQQIASEKNISPVSDVFNRLALTDTTAPWMTPLYKTIAEQWKGKETSMPQNVVDYLSSKKKAYEGAVAKATTLKGTKTAPTGTTTPAKPTEQKMPEQPIATDLTKEDVSSTLNSLDKYGIGQEMIDYIKDNPSKEAFISKFSSDIETMKKFMPGVDEKYLPKGASLAESVNDLYDTMQNEYKLNDMLDQINEMKKNNYNIEDTLTSYIRGKDTYIKEVDALMDKAEDAMFNKMDMSDPITKKMMNNYLDYLTILKGRQNQRYVDFLNTAVNENQASINSSIDLYNAKLNEFKTKFTMESAITEEAYTSMRTMLGEMYDAVQNADEKALQSIEYQRDMLKASSEILEYTNKLSGSANYLNTYLGDTKSYDPVLELGQGTITAKSITGTNEKENLKMFNSSIGAAMQTLINSGKDPNAFVAPLAKEIKDNSYYIGDKASLDNFFQNYSNVIMDYYNGYSTALNPETGKYEPVVQTATNTKNLLNALLGNFENSYLTFLDKNSGTVASIKNAISDLVYTTSWFRQKYRTKEDIVANKERWYEAHNDLPKTILDGIYNMATEAVPTEQFSDTSEIFRTIGAGDNRTVKSSINDLTASDLVTNIMDGLKTLFPLL